MKKPLQTFISYSRVNQQFAIKLACELKSAGFSVWMDQFDIPTGSRWDDEIEKALQECEIFLFIMTPASAESENAKDEVGYAIDHGKHILPVLLEKCDVPLRLRRLQYVDFTKKNFNEGVESAKTLLSKLVNEIDLQETDNQTGPIPVSRDPKTVPTRTSPHPMPASRKKTPTILVLAGVGMALIGLFLLGPEIFGKPPAPSPTPTLSLSTKTLLPSLTPEPTTIPYTQTPIIFRSFTEEFDENSRLDRDWNLQFRHGDIKKANNFQYTISNGELSFDLSHEYIWGYFFYDPSVIFDKVEMEVVAAGLKSIDTLGLICQYSEFGWYEFDIDGGGGYRLRYVDSMESNSDEGRYELKNGAIPGFNYSVIKTSDNILQIECDGASLSLRVNGNDIFRNYTNSLYKLTQGRIGIAVRSYDKYPVHFAVKSIMVREP